MPEVLQENLDWWQKNCTFPDSPYVFLNEAKYGYMRKSYGQPFKVRAEMMKVLCKKAKVKAFGFHAIRHLTASILYEMGQAVSVIQALLRHKLPNTTVM